MTDLGLNIYFFWKFLGSNVGFLCCLSMQLNGLYSVSEAVIRGIQRSLLSTILATKQKSI